MPHSNAARHAVSGGGHDQPGEVLRASWSAGRATLGAWIVTADSFAVEVLCRLGFDWIGIDMQHGLISPERLPDLLRAAAVTGTPALVRVAWNDPASILPALDTGAGGVIVPMVSSADDARRAVAACRYPPEGERSFGPSRAALGDPAYSAERANRSVLCFPMIETRQGAEDLAAILATPGIDGVFVGPSDLALSYGSEVAPSSPPPEHRERIEQIGSRCADAGLVPGIYCGGAAAAGGWTRAGFRLLALDSNTALLGHAAQDALGRARRTISAPGD